MCVCVGLDVRRNRTVLPNRMAEGRSDGIEFGASKLFPIIFQFRFRLNSHSAVWIRPSIDFNAPTKCWMMRRRRTKEEKRRKKTLHILCLAANVSFSVALSVRSFFGHAFAMFETSHWNERCQPETLNNVADEKVFRIVIGCTALCRRVCSQQQFISIVIVSVIDEFDFFSLASLSARAPRRLSSSTVILANATTKFDYNRSACDGILNAKKVIWKRMCERLRVNDFRPATFCAESCGFNEKKAEQIRCAATRNGETTDGISCK